MTSDKFKALKYGDILQVDAAGTVKLVLHTNRDATGNTTAIGVVEAFTPDMASKISLIASDPQETALIAPDGVTVTGILKTIPETK
jgi:hypothetical protein